jgi:hypothetical protein
MAGQARLSAICKQIVALDGSIRFAGVANKMGSLVTTTYRQGIVPFMTEEETSQYALRAVVRATTREDFETKLGRLRYSIGKYDRLVRATIPIPAPVDDGKSKFYLLLSFDIDSDASSIIERKVLPLIDSNQEVFD